MHLPDKKNSAPGTTPGRSEEYKLRANCNSNVGEADPVDKPAHTEVLRTSLGVVIERTLDSTTFKISCVWNPGPPYPAKMLKRLVSEYVPWRDRIFAEAAEKDGLTIVVVSSGVNGAKLVTTLGKGNST